MYDRSVKMFDESHPPKKLEELSKNGSLHKGTSLRFTKFHSIYLQMLTIHKLSVKSVLEIGPGENFTSEYMRNIDIKYDTMDIIEGSKPTILSRLEEVEEYNYKERWELVCAFQMLEHSPYENFVSNLKKMAIMSKRYVFISLPYSCFGFKLSLSLIFGQKWHEKGHFSFYFPLFKKNRKYRKEFMEEFPWAVHYWEIGRRGFPLRRINRDIKSVGLKKIKAFHSEFPYHYFILTEKINAEN